MDAEPLKEDALKGKVDIKWFGHCGFKISFLDESEKQRSIYVDIWIDNKDCPQEERMSCPNDADLILVTHGQGDHSMNAPSLLMASKKEGKKIVCNTEVGIFYEKFRNIPPQFFDKLQKGGTKYYGWCNVTMVYAQYPSTCTGPENVQLHGGEACGFVITIPNHDFRLYHAGDTNVFSDMKIIDDLYKPNVAMLPIGDCLGMGPREAAYCVKNFLPTPKYIIPMNFNSFAALTGTPEEFEKQCSEFGVEDKEIIHPKKFFGGAAILEKQED